MRPATLILTLALASSALADDSIEASIDRGVAFLLSSQNKDGSWGNATQTKGLNIYAPVPGAHRAFRAATTGLAVDALIRTGNYKTDASAEKALSRGENWLMDNLPYVRRATGDTLYNVWAHSYGTQALAAAHKLRTGDPDRQAELRRVIATQVDRLVRYASVDGGWGYYDFRAQAKQPSSSSISFTSATALVALKEARDVGVEVPQKLVDRAIAAINRQRKSDGSFLYGEYLKYSPLHPVNRPAGSLGRTQACYIALRRWGDTTVTDQNITDWLDKLITRNGWLDMGRKRPVPHESWFAVAGYFFYYGHYYAGLTTASLPAETSPPYKKKLAALIVPLQEKDGSWWDFPFYAYHQPYGTAFALLTLAECR